MVLYIILYLVGMFVCGFVLGILENENPLRFSDFDFLFVLFWPLATVAFICFFIPKFLGQRFHQWK